MHELEEAVEEVVDDIESYDGFPVGKLTASMMPGPIEALENAVEQGGDADKAMDRLVQACNACHASTDHGYIRITRARNNPFNQSFD